METHLLAGNTAKNVTKPFTIAEISSVVERLPHRNRFNRKRQHLKYKYEESDTDSDNKSDPETDLESSKSELSDYEHKHKKEKVKERAKSIGRQGTKTKALGSKVPEPKDEPKVTKRSQPDITSLVEQMSQLRITNPTYVQAYFKALLLNLLIADVFDKPVQSNATFANDQSTRQTTEGTT